MIPCLIDSLKELSPSDSVLQACEKANEKIYTQLEELDFTKKYNQLPKIESTLKKKFCIGKRFLALHPEGAAAVPASDDQYAVDFFACDSMP